MCNYEDQNIFSTKPFSFCSSFVLKGVAFATPFCCYETL